MNIEAFRDQHLRPPRDPYHILSEQPLPKTPVRSDWTIWN